MATGRESYATVEEADTYIHENYTSNDAYRRKWDLLSDEDKLIWLRKSTGAIDDRFRFIGRKKGKQSTKFPRTVFNYGIGGAIIVPYRSQYEDNSLRDPVDNSNDGMIDAKRATIENALAGCVLNETVQNVNQQRLQGLTSMKAGNVSKSFDKNSRGYVDSTKGIYTEKVRSILKDWIASNDPSI